MRAKTFEGALSRRCQHGEYVFVMKDDVTAHVAVNRIRKISPTISKGSIIALGVYEAFSNSFLVCTGLWSNQRHLQRFNRFNLI